MSGRRTTVKIQMNAQTHLTLQAWVRDRSTPGGALHAQTWQLARVLAEIEISIFERGCLSKRVTSFEHLWQHIVTLATERNEQQCRIHWRFTCADARAQMHELYPSPKIKLD